MGVTGIRSKLFDKNLEVLKEYYPQIYQKVHEKLENGSDNDNSKVEIETGKNGLMNIRVIHEDRKIFIHSSYDPYKEAERLIDFDPTGVDTIVIFGFGMGYHVEHMIKLFPEKNKIVIEPDIDIFLRCIENRDISNILKAKNTLLLLTNDWVGARDVLFELYRTANIYNCKFVKLLSYNTLYGKLFKDIIDGFMTQYNSLVVNIRTTNAFKNLWFYNFFYNMQHLNRTANLKTFEGKFESVPAVIVSSGPSLAKNIQFLKGLENKALICAAGSAISSLLNNGITPHVMLGIDGGPLMSEVYSTVNRDDILFTYVMNLHFDCVNKYPGKKLYIKSTAEPHVEYFENMMGYSTAAIASGGSCSNVSLDFLYKLGCDPIIVIGQDLAYTSNKTHVVGTIGMEDFSDDKVNGKDKDWYVKTKDMFGNDTYTTKVFMSMKYYFDTYFNSFAGKRTFINCSAEGLRLEGAEHISIEEAIGKYCQREIPIRESINALFDESINSSLVTKDKIDEFVNTIHSECIRSKMLSNERIELCNKILENLKKYNDKNLVKKRKELTRITEKFERTDFYKYFLWPSCKDMMLVYKNFSEQEALKETNVQKKLTVLYKGLLNQFKLFEEKILLLENITDELIKKQNGGNCHG